jgi:hypothetical protein
MLRPRLKIVFYSGEPRSGTKSRISGTHSAEFLAPTRPSVSEDER